jgi:predicted amidohydrolase
MFDFLLTGGRVIDPAVDRDEVADVAFADGRVAAGRAGGATGGSRRGARGKMVALRRRAFVPAFAGATLGDKATASPA